MHFPQENKSDNPEDDFKKYKFKTTFRYLIKKNHNNLSVLFLNAASAPNWNAVFQM